MTNLNELADKTKPWIILEFTHTDGKRHVFRSEVNKLTGDRLSRFDNDSPSINDSTKWIKSMVKKLQAIPGTTIQQSTKRITS